MPQNKVSKSTELSGKLWKEAFKALDPDQQNAINPFCQLLAGEEGIKPPRINTDRGRKKLLAIINKRSAALPSTVAASSSGSSPSFDRAVNVATKMRDLVSLGAAANPCATAAVAGFFVAFDLIRTHRAEKEAIFDIAVDSADAMCWGALMEHKVLARHGGESPELREARARLRGAFVQLYRTILFLSMKIPYKINGWRKWLVGWSAWRDEADGLQKAENRVRKFLDMIRDAETNGPPKAPNFTQKDKNETKLHRLVKDGRTNDVYHMIEAGECPKDVVNAKTSKGWTALMFAVKGGHWKIMNHLLNVSGIWVNAKNTDGNTALILAAQNNKPQFARKLLEGIAKPPLRNNGQRTAWLEAAMRGHLGVMRVLADKGDDVDQVTGKNGWCALHTAVEKNFCEMAEWLVLKRGARRDIRITGGERVGLTPREFAEKLGRAEIVKLLR